MAQASTTKCAVITGASGGIGSVVAKRLARDGFAVVVNYAGKPAKADEVVAAIKEAKGQAIAVQANVAEPADVERLFKQTIGAFGRVDVVVNCAGIMPMVPISGGDIKLFDNTININLRWLFHRDGTGCQEYLTGWPDHHVLKQRLGKVISWVWCVYCVQGGSRRTCPCSDQRVTRSRHYCQCHSSWTYRNRTAL